MEEMKEIKEEELSSLIIIICFINFNIIIDHHDQVIEHAIKLLFLIQLIHFLIIIQNS